MANNKSYTIKLGVGYDAEIIGKLESVKNKSAYIKELIRKDIAEELFGIDSFTDETEKIAKQYSDMVREKYPEQFDINAEKTISFPVNVAKDSDIIDRMLFVENKSGYVRELILKDMGLVKQNGERFLLADEDGNVRSEKRTISERRKEAQKRYNKRIGYESNRKWNKENLKRIPLDVSLDFFESIENHVEITGEPRNTFIKRAIKETIDRDKKINNKKRNT